MPDRLPIDQELDRRNPSSSLRAAATPRLLDWAASGRLDTGNPTEIAAAVDAALNQVLEELRLKPASQRPASTLTQTERIAELNSLPDLLRAIEVRKQELKRSCTHQYKDGSKATSPCGGGDRWCHVCDTQLD